MTARRAGGRDSRARAAVERKRWSLAARRLCGRLGLHEGSACSARHARDARCRSSRSTGFGLPRWKSSDGCPWIEPVRDHGSLSPRQVRIEHGAKMMFVSWADSWITDDASLTSITTCRDHPCVDDHAPRAVTDCRATGSTPRAERRAAPAVAIVPCRSHNRHAHAGHDVLTSASRG